MRENGGWSGKDGARSGRFREFAVERLIRSFQTQKLNFRSRQDFLKAKFSFKCDENCGIYSKKLLIQRTKFD
jgi:hypothetical protein